MRIANRISATEMLSILDNNWLSTKDIMAIASIGMTKALKLKHKIENDIENQGHLLPRGLVPTKNVIEALGIDIKYLKKLSCDKNNSPNPEVGDTT